MNLKNRKLIVELINKKSVFYNWFISEQTPFEHKMKFVLFKNFNVNNSNSFCTTNEVNNIFENNICIDT